MASFDLVAIYQCNVKFCLINKLGSKLKIFICVPKKTLEWPGSRLCLLHLALYFQGCKNALQNSRTCAFIQTYKDGLKGELFNWIAGIRKTITLTSEGTSKLVNMNFRGKGIGIFGGVIGQKSKWKYSKSFLNFVGHWRWRSIKKKKIATLLFFLISLVETFYL